MVRTAVNSCRHDSKLPCKVGRVHTGAQGLCQHQDSGRMKRQPYTGSELMRRAPMIVCLTLCLCACGDETQSGTSAVTTQEDTPSGDTQLSSDSGEENAGQDNNATGSAPPDNAASDMTETATVEPPPTPALECPEVGLDASAGALYYVCDCGSGADTDCVRRRRQRWQPSHTLAQLRRCSAGLRTDAERIIGDRPRFSSVSSH